MHITLRAALCRQFSMRAESAELLAFWLGDDLLRFHENYLKILHAVYLLLRAFVSVRSISARRKFSPRAARRCFRLATRATWSSRFEEEVDMLAFAMTPGAPGRDIA